MKTQRRSILARIFCIFAIGLLAQAQQNEQATTPANKSGASHTVKIDSVSKILISKDSPAFLISYSYDFGNRPAVYINGIGTVAPKGEFHYISQTHELEFRDSDDGKTLDRVPLVETIVVADTPPMNEVPSENQFPSDYRAFTWDLRAPLQERANLVLGKYFNYLPRDHGKVIYLATTYAPLVLEPRVSKSKTALIALLLSFPFDAVTGKYSFHIQSLVKEGRQRSDVTRSTNDLDILNAAKVFVDSLVSQLRAGGK